MESCELKKLKNLPENINKSSAKEMNCSILGRYELFVKVIASEKDYISYVTLIPSSDADRPVHVPVHYRADRNNVSWRAFPKELVLSQKGNTKLNRNVRVIPVRPSNLPLDSIIAECTVPSSSLKIRIDGNSIVASIVIECDAGSAAEDGILMFKDQAGNSLVKVPIIWYAE